MLHLAQEEHGRLMLLNSRLQLLKGEALAGLFLQVHHLGCRSGARNGWSARELHVLMEHRLDVVPLQYAHRAFPALQKTQHTRTSIPCDHRNQHADTADPVCAPPKRPAMSTTRAPQMPLLPTTTVSPGSTRLAMVASMPTCGVESARYIMPSPMLYKLCLPHLWVGKPCDAPAWPVPLTRRVYLLLV